MSYNNKLRIVALKNPEDQFGGEGFSAGNIVQGIAENLTSRIFEAQINPESFNREFKLSYYSPEEPGKKGEENQFKQAEAEILNLKFILDGTGAVPQNEIALDPISTGLSTVPQNDITDQAYVSLKVAQLQSTVYDFFDEKHRPPHLTVNYGKLVFFGVMEGLNIAYTLFNPVGTPLRAEVELSIKQDTPFKKQNALLSLLSPDLTRQHTVIGGENILRICDEAYEDQRYYIEIAKANKLSNFRSLSAGDKLTLPPIDKSSTL
jgi:nucleoid-associated protein YgaU